MAARWKLSIIYDSESLPGFEKGWGFSALITTDERNILFDCGWDGCVLRNNLGRLGFTFADINMIILSHSHWDHISGITAVLHDAIIPESIEVVVPSSFSKRYRNEIARRAKLREIDGPEEIVPGIYTTGVIGTDVKEQSLLVCKKGDCPPILITGCAHPGVATILKAAREIAEPKWLIGGFHDLRIEELPEDLEFIMPCHCTRHKEEIMKTFGTRARIGSAGTVLEIGQ